MSDLQKKPADKAVKAEPKKPNLFIRAGARLSRWFREMRSELKKVVWPTPKQILNNSIIVIVMVILVGAVIALFDWGAHSAVMAVINAFHPGV